MSASTNPEAVGPELVERMVALVRDLHADHLRYNLHDRQQDFCVRTAAIVAELPEPVDPDLIEVRALAATVGLHFGLAERLSYIADGRGDNWYETQLALAALKRGRELAKASPHG